MSVPPTPPPALSLKLQAAWLGRGPLALALWPLGALYAGICALRRAAFRAGIAPRVRLPVPVLVVGNVIAGGAGKTPTTLALVRHLSARGWHPGIVSRGYGRHGDDAQVLQPSHTAAQVGDEPLLMARRSGAPVAVARDRAEAGRRLLAIHPEVDILVCDDGLQHLRLDRDVEVLVFDERGVGNGWYLPAGPLRDSPRRHADLVLYNAPAPSTARPGHGSRRALARPVALAAWRRGETDTALAWEGLRARRVLAVAGVAHPARFFSMLRAQGLTPETLALPDHHDYAGGWPWRGWDGDVVLVTEKDAVKLDHCDDARVHVVALDLQPDPTFFQALDELLRRRGLRPRSRRQGHD
ncbi:MAG TPA: tetraacyldisaccharide 4'-kinase [Burkholderiaceae bacterium]|nr:tetraacyldisaccharide 4'-kinase [Burkholderiaceae bacterium]